MTLYREVDGVKIEMSAEEEAEIRASREQAIAESAATRYSRDRQNTYPSWQDQLDQIYHEGIDAWKVSVKKIKDDNPKP
jgi:hypothetical protein|tara:strand:- start:516 stop:752 length:237 start_codon:yes stop_codon:yes gene_type:complete